MVVLHPLQKAFEGHAVIIGAVIGAIIIPVCLSVTFSNILAKQVDRQRYLLEKEARKEQRRRRRNRTKFRDPFAESANTVVIRQDETAPQGSNQGPPLPGNHPAKKQSKADIPSGYPPKTLFEDAEQQKDIIGKLRKRSNDKNAPQRPSREMKKRRKLRERAISVGEPNQIVDKDIAKKRRKRRTQSQDVKLLQDCTTADGGKDAVQQKPAEPAKV